jgi:Sec7-like guanine-nucleotide exchange factor
MTKDMRKSYNLQDNFMEEIYNDIDANPISLRDEVEQHSYEINIVRNLTL